MDLKAQVITTIAVLVDRYFDDLPLDVVAFGIKTENYYIRVLSKGVRDVYNGRASEDELLDIMIRLLDEQMRKAWNEGMRENELDPQTDMTEEWEQILQEIIDNEFSHVEQFIDDIGEARDNGDPIDPLLARADLWAGRYADVVNQAKLETADKEEKFEWKLGATEEHCETCAALNGLVAYASEWQMSGFHPQQPENPMLDCGGWRCDCSLEPTDKRRSPDVLGTLLDLAASRGLGKSMKGGEGSGNFDHAGRPREVGGSAPGDGSVGGSDGGGDGGGGGNERSAAGDLYASYENDENTHLVYAGGEAVGFYSGAVQTNPPERIRELVGKRPYVLNAVGSFEDGRGRYIMSEVIKSATDDGATGLVLYSDNDNSSGFYRHIGFSVSPSDEKIFYVTKNEFGRYR